MNTEYSGANIKILDDTEKLEFDYLLIEHLAQTYTKPVNSIKRAVEACRLAGLDPKEYYEEKYLKGNSSIPANEEFLAISKELQKRAYSEP